MTEPRFDRSVSHQQRAHGLIPGGAHTYAKGDDQMPEDMPVVIARGRGCRVWDLDGNEYVEYGQGLRAVTLGHAEPRVTAAAAEWLGRGANFSRPAEIELRAAEAFLRAVPGQDMVKFTKDGSSATTAAVKLSRAATGRDAVAICADQPFLSQDDWFIGTTPLAAGIPDATRALVRRFPYGDADALRETLADGAVACVVMEAVRDASDPTAYMQEVQRVCADAGTLLVLDEMITGLRWHAGGVQTLYGLTPDLTTFGKALGNGFAVSALAGRRDLMELGGLRETGADRVFLLSATHGAETHALAAAVEVLRIYQTEDVVGTMEARGAELRRGVAEVVARHGLGGFVGAAGRDSNLVFFTRDADGVASQPFRTLFLREMTRRGVLGPSFVVSAAHDAAAIAQTLDALDGALAVYAQALDAGTADGWLSGRPVQPVFRRRPGVVWSSANGLLADGLPADSTSAASGDALPADTALASRPLPSSGEAGGGVAPGTQTRAIGDAARVPSQARHPPSALPTPPSKGGGHTSTLEPTPHAHAPNS